MVQNAGLTPQTAAIINNNFGAQSTKELKQAVKTQIGDMLRNGQIGKEEAEAALKYLDKDLAQALVRRNEVESTYMNWLNGVEDLQDAKANKLMKDAGLTINDLYGASRLAGADYEVSYTHLSKGERATAERGEITSAELKNIQNDLNAKIKANGGDKVLNEKETKQLMIGLGLSVESRFQVGKILTGILSGMGFGGILGITNTASASAEAVVSTTVATDVTSSTATSVSKAVANTSSLTTGIIGSTVGAVAGGVIGAISSANRKEEAFGAQGGKEGGEGSVTNKTEAKMHQVGTKAADAE